MKPKAYQNKGTAKVPVCLACQLRAESFDSSRTTAANVLVGRA